MSQNKYIKINKNILLEWIYDDTNLVTEQYSINTNLNDGLKSFLSTAGNNILANSVFMVDPVVKKWTKIDYTKYNFLQHQEYVTTPIPYHTLRLHFPAAYNFENGDYKGLTLRLAALGFSDTTAYYFSNFVFDNTVQNNLMEFENPFLFDEIVWGKYVEIQVPSVDFVVNQRNITSTSNAPIANSINFNLTQGEGLSTTTPIIVEMSFITTTETLFGVKYYYTTTPYRTSFCRTPEFSDLAANIQESTQGDYFELWGSYKGSNENLDDFVEELTAKGKSIRIEYLVSHFEENILQNTVTYYVDENFSQKIIHRPVFFFTNTTAAIDVEMRIIDLVDNSVISRLASIGLTTQIFKYGRYLSKLDVAKIIQPKVYVARQTKNSGQISGQMIPNINIEKAKYPVLIDKFKIAINSPNGDGGSTDWKPMGVLNILITPFDNVIKFTVGQYNSSNQIVPFNLTQMAENSKFVLTFKSDKEYLEKELWQESSQINYGTGTLLFKLNETDNSILKKIRKDNSNFYINLVANDTKTLLYSGKFNFLESVRFLSPQRQSENPAVNSLQQTTENISNMPVVNMLQMSTASVGELENIKGLSTIQLSSNSTQTQSSTSQNSDKIYVLVCDLLATGTRREDYNNNKSFIENSVLAVNHINFTIVYQGSDDGIAVYHLQNVDDTKVGIIKQQVQAPIFKNLYHIALIGLSLGTSDVSASLPSTNIN